ncbi:hypothetical protein M422DRAFT_160354 [Sphaerobolus stellatus SS14]|nr:hypothetical protein M422DRAFT_160354 [Sphaerobolus stellatus SS14]
MLIIEGQERARKPKPYKAGLEPVPSPLRPHCRARDRLILWKPLKARSRVARLMDKALGEILRVMEKGWATGTLSTYGSGLLLFHVFCNERNIDDIARCPANPTLLLAFVAACSGYYSGSTIANSLHRVRAWHLLHGAKWAPSRDELAAVLTGATRLAPASSKRASRELWTVEMLARVCQVLDPESNFDIAWYTALTTIFWSMACTGEFLVQSLNDFKEDKNITRARVGIETNGDSQVMVFTLPWTKVSPRGERVFWSRQEGLADPYGAFITHMHINDPPTNEALFSWKQARSWKVMTKSAFTKRMEIAAAEVGLLRVHGHGLRIGSVLEYLLRGLSFKQVKSMGWWSGESFALYLRQHAVVLAPYIQSVLLRQQTGQIALPPVRNISR